MKRFVFGIVLSLIWACSSGGLYKTGPCDYLEGPKKAECLQNLPAYHETVAVKPGKKYLPTQQQYDAVLQKIDDATEGAVNYLFY